MKLKKNMKFYQFVKTDLYKNADVIEVFDSLGKEVPDHEDIDDAKVLKVEVRGGWITVEIKRANITYDDIECITDKHGYHVCSCKLNGYPFNRTYIYYSKKEALRLFHELVNGVLR
jgi:hypothetical protein